MSELTAIFEFIKNGGVMAVVLMGLWALFTGRIRLGREVERAHEDRDYFRDRLLPLLERMMDALEELQRRNRND